MAPRVCVWVAACWLAAMSAVAAEPWDGAEAVAAKINELTKQHWQAAGVQPAGPADDATFYRRLMLDVAGRVPTRREAQSFVQDATAGKRAAAALRLVSGAEFPLHFANVLDDMLQGRYAGDREFIAYLRDGLKVRATWDQTFREIVIGPWETPEQKRADRFLQRRVKSTDELTNDVSRIFFGVDISCAKCHDHPLVDDWKQDHFYGLSSFFNRSYEFRGEQNLVGEKDEGEIEFVTRDGENRKAKLMFLSGRVLEEPTLADDPQRKAALEQAKKDKKYLPPVHSRREQLVQAALEDRRLFSRAMVNRIWAYLLGRGLVQPVDQMHSANPAAIPALLDWLAEDFAASGYHLERLIAGIVMSRPYQLSSDWPEGASRPAPELFAVVPLRPLSPKQYAVSLLLVTGDESFDDLPDDAARAERHKQLDDRANGLARDLDVRTDEFQSSVGESLFMSNHPSVQQLLKPAGKNLAARLLEASDDGQLIELADWSIFSRPPAGDEPAFLSGWLAARSTDRPAACRDLAWALLTSAEFRFSH